MTGAFVPQAIGAERARVDGPARTRGAATYAFEQPGVRVRDLPITPDTLFR